MLYLQSGEEAACCGHPDLAQLAAEAQHDPGEGKARKQQRANAVTAPRNVATPLPNVATVARSLWPLGLGARRCTSLPPPCSHSLPFTPVCKAKPQATLSCTHVLHVGIALLLSRGPRESEILYFLPVIRVNYTMHEYIRRCKIENIQCVSYRERADYNKVQIKFKVDWTIQNFVSSTVEVNSGD